MLLPLRLPHYNRLYAWTLFPTSLGPYMGCKEERLFILLLSVYFSTLTKRDQCTSLWAWKWCFHRCSSSWNGFQLYSQDEEESWILYHHVSSEPWTKKREEQEEIQTLFPWFSLPTCMKFSCVNHFLSTSVSKNIFQGTRSFIRFHVHICLHPLSHMNVSESSVAHRSLFFFSDFRHFPSWLLTYKAFLMLESCLNGKVHPLFALPEDLSSWNSQHTHCGSQWSIILVPRHLTPSSGFCNHQAHISYVEMHRSKKVIVVRILKITMHIISIFLPVCHLQLLELMDY